MTGFGFPAAHRIRSKSDFDALFKKGTRVHGEWTTLLGARAAGPSRLGIPCGKRFSKRAVDRNRFRRLVREAFRLEYAALPTGFDLLVMPRCKPGVATLAGLRTELPDLARRLARKLEARASG